MALDEVAVEVTLELVLEGCGSPSGRVAEESGEIADTVLVQVGLVFCAERLPLWISEHGDVVGGDFLVAIHGVEFQTQHLKRVLGVRCGKQHVLLVSAERRTDIVDVGEVNIREAFAFLRKLAFEAVEEFCALCLVHAHEDDVAACVLRDKGVIHLVINIVLTGVHLEEVGVVIGQPVS